MKRIYKAIRVIVFSIWSVLFTVWLGSLFTPLELSDRLVREECAILSIGGFFFYLLSWLRSRKGSQLVLAVSLVAVVICGLQCHLQGTDEEWETQAVLYTHGHFQFKSIELQERNAGPISFRVVEVTKLTPYFSLVERRELTPVGDAWIPRDAVQPADFR